MYYMKYNLFYHKEKLEVFAVGVDLVIDATMVLLEDPE